MKRNLYIIAIIAAFLSVSCEDFLDVNTDPNNPVSVTPDLLLPVAQTYTADINTGWIGARRGTNVLGNLMMFNWGESYGFSWHEDEFKYLVNSTFYESLWDDSYGDALKQYEDLIGLGEEYGVYEGIARIMQVFHFQILVDLYGDVPYTEALGRGTNPTPDYDDASAIYLDLITELTEAIDLLKTTEELAIAVLPEEDDVMYGGDITSWVKLANTLKIRILLRESGVVDASYINTELAVIEAEGSGYITEDVAVNPGYLEAENQQNPFWDGIGWDAYGNVSSNNDATCATQYVLDLLTSTNDPRIDYIYEEPETGHLGVDQGADNEDSELAADFVSNVGTGLLKDATQDAIIFTLAEHYFNLAELAFEGFTSDDTETLYDMGVTASFDYLGVDGVTSYLAVNAYSIATDKLDAIITQKWIALNGIDAVQTWFDYSRTGYPSDLPVSIAASTANDDRPVRLAYPSSEVTSNPNKPEQLDVFAKKIFWANFNSLENE